MLIAGVLVPLFAVMTAVVVDGGATFAQRRDYQSTADLTALAAVVEMPDEGAAEAKAEEWLTRNGFDTSGDWEITFPASNRVYVRITGEHDPIFSGFGVSPWDVSANATAELVSESSEGASPYGLMALGCNNNSSNRFGVSKTGSGDVIVHDGDIYSGCDGNRAITTTGSGDWEADGIRVVGGVHATGSGDFDPTPTTGVDVVPDPLAGTAPPVAPDPADHPDPSCSGSPINFSRSGSTDYTISPGCYSQIRMNGSGDLTMLPGVYHIFGDLTMGGSGDLYATSGTYVIHGEFDGAGSNDTHLGGGVWHFQGGFGGSGSGEFTSDGQEVLLYATGGYPFNLNGSGDLELIGHSGYGNVAVWIADGGRLRANGSGDLLGVLYNPNDVVEMIGSGDTGSSVVAKYIELTGSGDIEIHWDPDHAAPGGDPIFYPKLVQ